MEPAGRRDYHKRGQKGIEPIKSDFKIERRL